LINFNAEKIEQVYVLAKKDSASNPLILVVDCRDKAGGALAGRKLGEATYQAFLEDCRRNNVVPTLVLAYPLQEAAEALAALTPGARQVLSRRLQPGVFWVVALAGDGNSFATMSTPEDRGPPS
jgi:hypothetical protein